MDPEIKIKQLIVVFFALVGSSTQETFVEMGWLVFTTIILILVFLKPPGPPPSYQ